MYLKYFDLTEIMNSLEIVRVYHEASAIKHGNALPKSEAPMDQSTGAFVLSQQG